MIVACLQIGTFLNLSKEVGRHCSGSLSLCLLPYLARGSPVRITTVVVVDLTRMPVFPLSALGPHSSQCLQSGL